MTQQVSAQFLRAVFQRHIDRLGNQALSAVRQHIINNLETVSLHMRELESNLSANEQEFKDVRRDLQTRTIAAAQFHRRYRKLSKLMERHKDKAESCSDQYFPDFSMYKKLLIRKMDRLAACAPDEIDTQVKDVAEYIISLGVRGMNHRSMWRLCRQSYEAIGNPPAVLSVEILEKLAVLPDIIIKTKTELDKYPAGSLKDAQELHSKLVSLSW
jgi:hypothetical protein